MAALTANRRIFIQDIQFIRLDSNVLAVDSDEFYEGQLVSYNGSSKLVPSSDTAGHIFAGVCTGRYTSGATNLTVRPEIRYGHLEWFPVGAGIDTATDVGILAMIEDDNTVTDAAAATNDIPCGRIKYFESKAGVSGAWILIGAA